MKDLRDNDRSNGVDLSLQLAFVGLDNEATSLPNGALSMLTAPTLSSLPSSSNSLGNICNGCISEISSDAIHAREHDYNAAMRSYGIVYEEYQAYLLPTEHELPHDYDLAAKPIPDFSHIGCLNAELLDSTVVSDDISDDDIEGCGYMAWVHH